MLKPWLSPDIVIARNYADDHCPREVVNGTPLLHSIIKTSTGRYCFDIKSRKKCNILREGSLSDLEAYGPGVTNYFKFIKWCLGIFLILVITYSPILFFNVYGSPLDLSRTTVSNLRNYDNNLHIAVLGSEANIALLYSLLVALGSIVILSGILWLRFFEKKELVDAHVVTVADYTVEVSNFPKNINLDENQLKNHIVAITGHRVVDVVIAYNSRRHIKQLQYRGLLVKQQVHLINEYHYHHQQSSLTAQNSIQQKLNKLTAKINTINVKIRRRFDDVVPLKAYITFEQPLKCLTALSNLKSPPDDVATTTTTTNASIYQGLKLHVRPAPEPASIIWENLQCWSLQQILRRFITSLILIFLLVITVGAFLFTNMLGMQFVSIGILLTCSLLIEPLVRSLVKFEMYTNKDTLESSIFWKLFLLKFIITGCSFLLLQSHITATVTTNLLVFVTSVKGYCPQCIFTTAWFDDVTLSVVLVQLGDIILPHVFKGLSYCNLNCRINRLERRRSRLTFTQEELNELYIGPEFVLCHRYAQLLSTFFVCLIYAAGIPLLVVIALIHFIVSFWVDKILFLRFYRSPTRFYTTVSSQASGLIVLSVLLHLAVSIWILNQEEIFPYYYKISYYYQNYNNVYDKFSARHALSKLHIFILFLLGLVTIISVLVYTILTYLRACCCHTSARELTFDDTITSFSTAIQSNLLQGLTSYNILKNPTNKSLFGISDQLANQHNSILSLIHSLGTEAPAVLPPITKAAAAATVASPSQLHPAMLSQRSIIEIDDIEHHFEVEDVNGNVGNDYFGTGDGDDEYKEYLMEDVMGKRRRSIHTPESSNDNSNILNGFSNLPNDIEEHKNKEPYSPNRDYSQFNKTRARPGINRSSQEFHSPKTMINLSQQRHQLQKFDDSYLDIRPFLIEDTKTLILLQLPYYHYAKLQIREAITGGTNYVELFEDEERAYWSRYPQALDFFCGYPTDLDCAFLHGESALEKWVELLQEESLTEILTTKEISFLKDEYQSKLMVHENRFGATLLDASPVTYLVQAKMKSVKVRVIEADIFAVECHIIVNPANTYLSHKGGIALAIAKAAGQQLDAECQLLLSQFPGRKIPDGNIVVTSPYNITLRNSAVRNIIHAVGPIYTDGSSSECSKYRETVRAALNEAVRCGAKSINIPLFGAGIFKWPASVAARQMIHAISEWVASAPNSKLVITLVDFCRKHAEALNTAVRDFHKIGPTTPASRYTQPPPQYVWYWEKKESNTWGPYNYDQILQIETAMKSSSFPLILKGEASDSKNIPEGETVASYEIQRENCKPVNDDSKNIFNYYQLNMKTKFKRLIRREDYIPGQSIVHGYCESNVLADTIAPDPMTAPCASIDYLISTKTTGLSLYGTINSIAKMKPFLVDLIKQSYVTSEEPIDLAVNDSEPWETTKSKLLSFLAAFNLEVELLDEPNKSGHIRLRVLGAKGLQKAERKVNKFINIEAKNAAFRVEWPAEWTGGPFEHSTTNNVTLQPVTRGSDEWAKVEDEWRGRANNGPRLMFKNKLIGIQRVQNAVTWAAYYNRIFFLASKVKRDTSNIANTPVSIFSLANECWMKHGTRKNDPSVIIWNSDQGIDSRHSKEGYYGIAAYTSEDMEYCHGSYTFSLKGQQDYCRLYGYTQNDNHSQVFLVRVAAGKIYHVDTRDDNKHPAYVKPPQGYDSVRGPVDSKTKAIMTYQPDTVYPAYLITYEN